MAGRDKIFQSDDKKAVIAQLFLQDFDFQLNFLAEGGLITGYWKHPPTGSIQPGFFFYLYPLPMTRYDVEYPDTYICTHISDVRVTNSEVRRFMSNI